MCTLPCLSHHNSPFMHYYPIHTCASEIKGSVCLSECVCQSSTSWPLTVNRGHLASCLSAQSTWKYKFNKNMVSQWCCKLILNKAQSASSGSVSNTQQWCSTTRAPLVLNSAHVRDYTRKQQRMNIKVQCNCLLIKLCSAGHQCS